MAIVWSRSHPVSVGEANSVLPGEPTVAYSTVKTTMERLAAKGILARTKEGRGYRYWAAVSQEDLERRIVSRILENLVEQFPRAVASFLNCLAREPAENRLARLLEAIERRCEDQDL